MHNVVKKVTAKFSRKLAGRRCAGNFEEAVEMKDKLCDDVV